MRLVTYKEYVKVGEINEPGKAYVAGKFELREMGRARFHQFGMNYEEFEAGPGNYSVAIIELPDGTVKCVPPEHIKFVSL